VRSESCGFRDEDCDWDLLIQCTTIFHGRAIVAGC